MTWATVITLLIFAIARLGIAFERNKTATDNALGLSMAMWLATCAYAMWDRYL